MTQILRCFVLFSVLLAADTASAQGNVTIGGDTLLRWMQTKDERDGALAFGYIMGVREMTYQKDHCASVEVKPMESVNAVKRTLDGLPQHRNLPASLLVVEALKARWPCPVKGKTKTGK